MLGLGDIVVPGVFVALALRYDYQRFLSKGGEGYNFSRPYFTAAVLAYIAGLATTMTVMHVFKAAQPALLYLRFAPYFQIEDGALMNCHCSPACILSFVITAVTRGELRDAWSWSDETPEDKSAVDGKGISATNPLLTICY